MKAIRIHSYGGADVLVWEDAPMPEIGSDDVLIRTVATSVNPVDWKFREGYLKGMIPPRFPLILGWDVSGVVEKVGADVTAFAVNDAVFSRPDILRDGTYAEYVAVRASEVAKKPATISHVEAASLPLTGITAWEVLVTTANLSSGQRVLIHGGSGGVGTLAIQLAKIRGAHVTTTCSARNADLVRSLGADEVIDYRTQDFSTVVRDMDVVFDTMGGDVQEKSWSVLKPGGMLASISATPSPDRAKAEGKRAAFVFIKPDATVLATLAGLVDSGRMRPVIGAEFALKDLAKAHEWSQGGKGFGKIAIHVGQP
jgi:NADPH:quinone reductase-like Zn-dependent oxidoreductase